MRIGAWEIAIIVVVILLIFGPKKLPELGKGMAEFFRNFKKGVKDEDPEKKA